MDDDDSTSEASYSQYMPRHAHPHSARPLFNEQTPALSHAPTPSYFADQQQPVASTSAQPYTAAMNGYAGTGYGDEEDELDDLQSATEDEDEDSSDEEALAEQQLRAVQAKKMEAVKGLYKGERVLPEEEFGSKTVREIYDMLKAGVINLSPDYQREAVRYKLVHPDAQIDPENKARLPAGWKGESDSDGESELEEDVDAKGRAKGKKVPRKV
ncbi:hypothetical protein NBRC10512_001728 [Rhodotorula toruloides]|uniref:Uncharacterized protein n=1 Tax=Rhodotorula toruloides (strain NP11) TaxID=1130832 RepID=M7X3R3_RHOT1|nr:uncharacterized protein RHTO_02707 [Rhodotorula toruloides NP11]EMS24981.1 hypothetical protein RHTO_02707 [Rhodotorula toruloides NP11]